MRLRNVFILCLIFAGLSGCAKIPHFSKVTIILDPANEINEGVLLPVDVLALDAGQSASALEIGPDDWFGNDFRDRLTGKEIQRLAFRGGKEKIVSIKANDDVHRIIVFADFENNSDRSGQQVIIIPGKYRFLPKYTISINKDTMELVR